MVPSTQLPAPRDVRRAYALLVSAESFSDAHVGFAGAPSCEVVAFQVVLESYTADRAFKQLLSDATLPGQLYGLSGLYFTDPPTFCGHVERYRVDATSVPTDIGGVTERQSVASLVSATHVDGPNDLPIDIACGGWPTAFKNAFKQRGSPPNPSLQRTTQAHSRLCCR
jgi:hypothetical protein